MSRLPLLYVDEDGRLRLIEDPGDGLDAVVEDLGPIGEGPEVPEGLEAELAALLDEWRDRMGWDPAEECRAAWASTRGRC